MANVNFVKNRHSARSDRWHYVFCMHTCFLDLAGSRCNFHERAIPRLGFSQVTKWPNVVRFWRIRLCSSGNDALGFCTWRDLYLDSRYVRKRTMNDLVPSAGASDLFSGIYAHWRIKRMANDAVEYFYSV